MPHRHDGRRPERDEEADIDRMAHKLVEKWRLELRRGHRPPCEVVRNLVQPEQFKMIDQESAKQNCQPADE